MFAFNLGFGGVAGPAEIPQEIPSQFRPEMKGMPEMVDAGVENIRTQGTLLARKPPVADISADNLSFGESNRSITARQVADDMRVSYAVSNAYKKRGEARAKARARQTDRRLKNADSAGRIQRRKLQGNTKRMEKSAVLRNAAMY